MAKVTVQELLAQYDYEYEKYVRLEQVAAQMIEDIVAENDLFVMEIMHRTKDPEALQSKIVRKNGKYRKLTDVTDLVGIRIICYFSDSVDEIAAKIAEVFDIDKKNSIDKRATLSATQFGYLSLHYICMIREDADCSDDIKGIPFEVQMRTVLQHAWAEIEHDLGYKSDFGVPRGIRRQFSQTASILEVADRQFVEIRDHAADYTVSVRRKIADDNAASVLVDKISLKEYITHNKFYLAMLGRIRDKYGIDIDFVETDSTIAQLEWLNINTIEDLTKLFQRNEESLDSYFTRLSEEYGVDIISSNALFKNVFYSELKNEKYTREQIRRFLMLSIYDDKKLEKTINKILA